MIFAFYFNLHMLEIRNILFYVLKLKKYTSLSAIMDFQKKNFTYFYLNMKEKFISFSKIYSFIGLTSTGNELLKYNWQHVKNCQKSLVRKELRYIRLFPYLTAISLKTFYIIMVHVKCCEHKWTTRKISRRITILL